MTGTFITLEGCDGVGKSTQIKQLADFLTQKGKKVLCTNEPQGEQLGKNLCAILKHDIQMTPMSEILLFTAARIEHARKVIKPALTQNIWVISDRYQDSTRAYQSILLNDTNEMTIFAQLEKYAFALCKPDISFILDMDVKTLTTRKHYQKDDLFENRGQSFMEKVRLEYHKIYQDNKHRCILINADQPSDKVTQDIIKKLEPLL